MLADQLIAHRGWQARYPENTLPALQGAMAIGARHVEFDIQLTADHEPVLCHDPTLQRMCASPVDITQAHRELWQALSAHEPGRFGERFIGTPLTTLAEAVALFEQHRDVTVYAEIKRHSLRAFGAERVLDVALPLLSAISSRCVLISFDVPVLQRARERGWQRVAPVLIDWPQAFSNDVAALSPELLFGSEAVLSALALDAPCPFPCAVYEVDTLARARAWLARGAHRVETFAIGELLQAAQMPDEPEHARHVG